MRRISVVQSTYNTTQQVRHCRTSPICSACFPGTLSMKMQAYTLQAHLAVCSLHTCCLVMFLTEHVSFHVLCKSCHWCKPCVLHFILQACMVGSAVDICSTCEVGFPPGAPVNPGGKTLEFHPALPGMQGQPVAALSSTTRVITLLLIVYSYNAAADTFKPVSGTPRNLPTQIHYAQRALQLIDKGMCRLSLACASHLQYATAACCTCCHCT